MCGIAGFVSSKALDEVSQVRSIVERMNGEIAHRGPDDFGYFQDEFVALGHRRLSIVDVAGGQIGDNVSFLDSQAPECV